MSNLRVRAAAVTASIVLIAVVLMTAVSVWRASGRLTEEAQAGQARSLRAKRGNCARKSCAMPNTDRRFSVRQASRFPAEAFDHSRATGSSNGPNGSCARSKTLHIGADAQQ